MGEVGDEFSEEDLVAKVTDLYYKSFSDRERIFTKHWISLMDKKKTTKQNNNFCLSIEVTAKRDLLKLFLPWALKKLSILLPFIHINM